MIGGADGFSSYGAAVFKTRPSVETRGLAVGAEYRILGLAFGAAAPRSETTLARDRAIVLFGSKIAWPFGMSRRVSAWS
jgi:hypothetical protein